MSRWWSDYDHVADLNTGAADVCTHALGHVYLVGRKESLESCNKAKQECFEEAKGVRKESFNLQEEVNTLRRTWGKMLMYPQKQPAANTGLPLNPAGTVRDTIEECTELCISNSSRNYASYSRAGDRLCRLYGSTYKQSLSHREDLDLLASPWVFNT
ncbi:hypothetical protein BDV34DRAFT_219746 [Aspergillus parasiticus]|uniref:Uncharacterized protein n=1 Tax=Aspergillus parasiticus TaxID=5067 RepID=A0A5N6E0V0_ASPPA|nr:hypothetical protein BDV34DRAFT_219746 [Aspergillus parasiticus]